MEKEYRKEEKRYSFFYILGNYNLNNKIESS